MVEIRANSSMPGWFEVIYEGEAIKEVQGRRKVLLFAKEASKKKHLRHIFPEDKVIEAEDSESSGPGG